MNIEYPPRLEGSEREQLQALWAYLYRLAERLNAERSGSGDRHG